MDITVEMLLQALREEDRAAVLTYYGACQPVDFAGLAAQLPRVDIRHLALLLDSGGTASLLASADETVRQVLAKALDDDVLLPAFTFMQKDDIVDLLGDLSIGRRKQLVNLMKADDRKIITNLLRYPEDSAGGLMTTGYIALREYLTVGEGLAKLLRICSRTEQIQTIYIINRERQLIGKVDLRTLLVAPRHKLLRELMDPHVISVRPETDQAEAARLVARYDLNAIPVVSRKEQILGIITVDDVIDVIVEESEEDLLQLAGVSKEENLSTSLTESVRLRLPWLFVNLLTAFLASFTVKLFEDTIAQVVALSAIMTIVTGMGGNAGTQTMSILVRQLARGEITLRQCWRPFFKEVLLGIVNGAANGMVTGLVVWAVYGNIYLGMIVFFAMIGNLVVAGIFGFWVPILLAKCHADPAVSSSIFLTTATDVLGFFIFLGLARLFLPYLL